jgi:hypothetical protein
VHERRWANNPFPAIVTEGNMNLAYLDFEPKNK